MKRILIVVCCMFVLLLSTTSCKKQEVNTLSTGGNLLEQAESIFSGVSINDRESIEQNSNANQEATDQTLLPPQESEPNGKEDLPYWVDEPDPWGPTESIVSEERREYIRTEYQKGYNLIKNQAWSFETGEENYQNNIILLVNALSQLSAEETPPITYSQMKTSALCDDLEVYMGELVFWASAHIDTVTTIEEDTELAQSLNQGNSFSIVEATTKHDEYIRIYIMDSKNVSTWYQPGINHSLKGWVVGADENGLVLCVPSLSGG